MAAQDETSIFRHHAAEFEDFLSHLGARDMADPRRLTDELAVRLRRFAQRCEAQGIPAVQARPARLALAALADQTVRTQRHVDMKAWSGLARQGLFDGRDMNMQEVAGFADIAKAQGPEFSDLAAFLDHCMQPLANARGLRRLSVLQLHRQCVNTLIKRVI